MKALFICLDYYPYNGACTNLFNKMLFEGKLLELLGDVHVLTIKKNAEESDIEFINGITIHRCLPPVLMSKKDVLHIWASKPILALQASLVKLADKAKGLLQGEEPVFKKNVVAVLARKMHQLECESYDVIIPIFGYAEAAAAAVKSKFPMVLYQVDPCATNARFSNVGYEKARLFEKNLYEVAVSIITTPIIYQDILRDYSQRIVEKTHAMEFPNISRKVDTGAPETHKEIRCLFAGSIYPLARNPRYTVELFSQITPPEIKLVFAGATRESVSEFVDEKQIGDNMTFLGMLPLEQAQKEMQNADILINIGNIMTNQVPSKIFEYISACKPIINICVNKDCPTIPYLEKYPLALSIIEGVGTPEEHAAEIERFIIENAGRTVEKATVLELFKECTAEYCAEQMAQVVTSFLKEDSVHNG